MQYYDNRGKTHKNIFTMTFSNLKIYLRKRKQKKVQEEEYVIIEEVEDDVENINESPESEDEVPASNGYNPIDGDDLKNTPSSDGLFGPFDE